MAEVRRSFRVRWYRSPIDPEVRRRLMCRSDWRGCTPWGICCRAWLVFASSRTQRDVARRQSSIGDMSLQTVDLTANP